MLYMELEYRNEKNKVNIYLLKYFLFLNENSSYFHKCISKWERNNLKQKHINCLIFLVFSLATFLYVNYQILWDAWFETHTMLVKWFLCVYRIMFGSPPGYLIFFRSWFFSPSKSQPIHHDYTTVHNKHAYNSMSWEYLNFTHFN